MFNIAEKMDWETGKDKIFWLKFRYKLRCCFLSPLHSPLETEQDSMVLLNHALCLSFVCGNNFSQESV